MNKHYWTGHSGGDPYAVTQGVLDALSTYGVIARIQRYSDLMVGAVVEVEGHRLEALRRALAEHLDLDAPTDGRKASEPCLLFLNVRMTEGTGDLRTLVPEVPG